jgi:radical SAM superfamily enzyme YgiQ (UPF0313 family)
MKVCLIQVPPASEFDRHWARFPVLGLAYVSAMLQNSGHEVVVLDGKLNDLTASSIVDLAVAENPGLIGITCMTVEFPMAAGIAEQIKRRCGIPIVLGGAHVNAVGSVTLEECAAIDFACVGEGEHFILEMIEMLQGDRAPAEVSGLCYRAGESILTTEVRAYPDNYDALPFPAWHLFKVGEQVPILTHRGCPYRCTFCGHNSGFKARFRSVESVLAELNYIVATFAPSVVRFEDETFGLDIKRTTAILNGIIEQGLNKRVMFSAQTRVDRVDDQFIRLLRDANFDFLELGVESGNPQILKEIKKGISLDQVERAVSLARQFGLNVWCKFILGHPNETPKTLRDTIRVIGALNPERLSVSIMTPYPGTPIHKMALAGEGGYRLLSTDWRHFDKYSTGALELAEASLAKLKAYQMFAYIWLYIRNGRILELLQLIVAHRRMAAEMVFGWFKALLRPTAKIAASDLRRG